MGAGSLNESQVVCGAQNFAPLRIMNFLGKSAVSTYGVTCLCIHTHNLVKDQMSQMASMCIFIW